MTVRIRNNNSHNQQKILMKIDNRNFYLYSNLMKKWKATINLAIWCSVIIRNWTLNVIRIFILGHHYHHHQHLYRFHNDNDDSVCIVYLICSTITKRERKNSSMIIWSIINNKKVESNKNMRNQIGQHICLVSKFRNKKMFLYVTIGELSASSKS